MIEIPESLVIAQQLNETVKGKRIIEVKAAHTPHSFAWYSGDPQFYSRIMEGRRIGKAAGIGCMIEIELESEDGAAEAYSFVVGDGANIRYFAPKDKLPDRYQTGIFFEDDSALICTVAMYGAMFLIQPAEYENPYYLVAKEKPMPGTEEFDYAYFKALREEVSGKMSMKAFLATEQRIPGLGNGVLQDILLEAGLHPKTKISALREADWKRVYEAVVTVLQQIKELGGRDTERTLLGVSGGYATKLSKKTVGKGCCYCGTTIQKMNYLGGTVYFCPTCQK
ncbi:MAG: endonuclease VIII [Lachnospiraceae bacterium]|nr:endonuclease VIII [Lachnospiraceae bacterium]